MKVLLLGLATAALLATGCPVTRQCSAEADCDGVLYRCREGQCIPPWVSLPDAADAGTSSSSSSSSGSSGNCRAISWDLVRGAGGTLDVLWAMDDSPSAANWSGAFASYEDDLVRPLVASGAAWRIHLITTSVLAPASPGKPGECRRLLEDDQHLLFSSINALGDDSSAGLYAARVAMTPGNTVVSHAWGMDGGIMGQADDCRFNADGPNLLVVVADSDEGNGLETDVGVQQTVEALRALRPDLRLLLIIPADGNAQGGGGCVSAGNPYPLYNSAVSQMGNASQRLNLCDFHPGSAAAFSNLAANMLRSCVRVFPGTVAQVENGNGAVTDFAATPVDGGTRVVLGSALCTGESQVTVQSCQ
jgi:hypothetical protein